MLKVIILTGFIISALILFYKLIRDKSWLSLIFLIFSVSFSLLTKLPYNSQVDKPEKTNFGLVFDEESKENNT